MQYHAAQSASSSSPEFTPCPSHVERRLSGVGVTLASRYQLTRVIGSGGMGFVYEAIDTVEQRRVAAKLLRPELVLEDAAIARFIREARLAAKVSSRHAVHVRDYGVAESGEPFCIMDLIEGETLATIMRQRGALPAREACEIARQCLLALEAIHACGIVHRDLKPENVMVTQEGGGLCIKLIDFGIAKRVEHESESLGTLTAVGMVVGTPAYMSPERARGVADVDARGDVYSVGVLLYEMLTSRRPFDTNDLNLLVRRIEGGRVERVSQLVPRISKELELTVHKAMHPLSQLRYANALEARLAIEQIIDAENVSGNVLSSPSQLTAVVAIQRAWADSFRDPSEVDAKKESDTSLELPIYVDEAGANSNDGLGPDDDATDMNVTDHRGEPETDIHAILSSVTRMREQRALLAWAVSVVALVALAGLLIGA